MTLLYTEVEEELRAAVRSLLADRCPPSAVLKRVESPVPYDLELWKTLAGEIGVAGLLIPEEFGGAGATAREAAVVLEELCRAVAPVPFFTSSVLATDALVTVGAGEVLERLATGEIAAALVVPLGASPYQEREGNITVTDGRLSGRVRGVAGAEVADLLVVPVAGGLYLVERAEARVEVGVSLDLTRPVGTVVFEHAPATALGPCDLRETLTLGAALLASEQLGVAEWCLETTVAYGRERFQFA